MTVKELIDQLQRFDPSQKVKALWDDVSDWDVNRVEELNGVVILDVDSHGGSFDDIKPGGRP